MELNWLQKPLTHLVYATAAIVALHMLCNLPMHHQDRRVQREMAAEDRRVQREIKLKVADIKLALVAQGVAGNTVMARDVHVLGKKLMQLDEEKGPCCDFLP
jgi:hypothetical protein